MRLKVLSGDVLEVFVSLPVQCLCRSFLLSCVPSLLWASGCATSLIKKTLLHSSSVQKWPVPGRQLPTCPLSEQAQKPDPRFAYPLLTQSFCNPFREIL